jgi:hypothetical protein
MLRSLGLIEAVAAAATPAHDPPKSLLSTSERGASTR